jgi:hypothetical protein
MIKHSILQWNARSLDEEKAAELSRLAAECGASVLLLSELGPRRTIANFKPIACSDMFTQSGIFIHSSLNARIVETDHLEHDRIIVRAAIIDEAFLIMHPYIPPESSLQTRKKFWRKIEQFCLKHNNVPIILSGDLNTRSPLFNENHRESHDYLNDLLDAAELSINNTGEPTRGPNALDVTMSNQSANLQIISWEPLDALTSDHLPCLISTNFLSSSQLSETPEMVEILDYDSTITALESSLRSANLNAATLEEFILKIEQCKVTKLIKLKKDQKSFWNDELTELVNTRNRLKRLAARSPNNPRIASEYRKQHQGSEKPFGMPKQNTGKSWFWKQPKTPQGLKAGHY